VFRFYGTLFLYDIAKALEEVMIDPKAGGPAFPQSIGGEDGSRIVSYDFMDGGGMSLRDYFAGQILTGPHASGMNERQIALWAYQVADAMLQERAK
jgi:hypothetical protein